jgi:hypothetical protein
MLTWSRRDFNYSVNELHKESSSPSKVWSFCGTGE